MLQYRIPCASSFPARLPCKSSKLAFSHAATASWPIAVPSSGWTPAHCGCSSGISHQTTAASGLTPVYSINLPCCCNETFAAHTAHAEAPCLAPHFGVRWQSERQRAPIPLSFRARTQPNGSHVIQHLAHAKLRPRGVRAIATAFPRR